MSEPGPGSPRSALDPVSQALGNHEARLAQVERGVANLEPRMERIEAHLTAQDQASDHLRQALDTSNERMERRTEALEDTIQSGFLKLQHTLQTYDAPLSYSLELMAREEQRKRVRARLNRQRRYFFPRIEYVLILVFALVIGEVIKTEWEASLPSWGLALLALIVLFGVLLLIIVNALLKGEEQAELPDSGDDAHPHKPHPEGAP